MGYRTADTLENLLLKIKGMFENEPAENAFCNAFCLSALIHEAAASKGYKINIPWNTGKTLKADAGYWGGSIYSDIDGSAVRIGNGIFIADNSLYRSPTQSEMKSILRILENLSDKTTLKILFALYDLSVCDFDSYFSVDAIAEKSNLSHEIVTTALDRIPCETNDDGTLYRLAVCFLHIPPLLIMLRDR